MTLQQAKDAISKMHSGASYVIVYRAKAWLADGKTQIEKVVEKPARFGVRYGNMKHMAGFKPNPLPGNGHWVIDKYVYEDNNGFKMRFTNDAFGKPQSKYFANGVEVDESKCWHSNKKCPIVQCVCLENVIAIKRKGETL